MDRRSLILTSLASGASFVLADAARGQSAPSSQPYPSTTTQQGAYPPPPEPPPASYPAPPDHTAEYPANTRAETYSREEIVNQVSDFLGVTAEAAGSVVERLFAENGRPTGYIAGEEASAAITIGARYGKGLLYMKNRPTQRVFWQGPSIGWDLGGNASRVFTLCYNLHYPDAIFRRFPGVEGSAYLIGGLGVNYQRADDIVLAPIRAGLGLRLGANVGYLSYSRTRHLLPF